MSAQTGPDNPSTRIPLTLAAVIAVLALALAAMVATSAGARAQSGELSASGAGQGGAALLVAQRGQHQVGSLPLTGGPLSVATDAVTSPQGLVRHGDTLFVSEADGGNRVVSVPVAGGTATPVVTGLSSPRGLAVAGGKLYVADSANNRVISVPLDGEGPLTGGAPTVVAEGGLDSPRGLAIAGDALFIADRHNDRVVTVSLDGSAGGYREFKDFGEEVGYLATSGDTLYVAAMNGTVWTVPVAGGSEAPVELVTGLNGIRGIAIHGDMLYIGEAGGADEDDRIVAVPLGGGDPTPVADVAGINDLAISADPCSGPSCLPVVGSLFGSLG